MYYLHHYFNPDFSHMHLAPPEEKDGIIDQRYLGYVQNVVAGQVLAEIIDLEKFPDFRRDPRFIYPKRHFPVGPNCAPHPENPDKIVASVNGYVFYNEGLISVKKLLNVRGNVGFHTGNIFFVGDLAVHGDVQTGFSVHASNILVKGHIESAKVKALRDVVCLAGLKGANTSAVSDGPENAENSDEVIPSTLIEAGENIRIPFCEHVQIRARGNLIIDGSCLHSTLYVGGNLVVKGRLQGGAVYANGLVYVEGQLGSDYSMPTKVMMGYNPFDFLTLQKLESQIAYLKAKLDYFERMAARNAVMEQEYSPRVDLMQRKLRIAHSRRAELWRKFAVDEKNAPKCRIVVPGRVMPGSEIGIGRAFLKLMNFDENVTFSLYDEEIVSTPIRRKHAKA
ncbi:FapA family protein [Desulfovibrio sp. OttesenSCG-928-A18]|nr:FapA family protein [Desulfovibrio sp. OttesenSCG-928-A18]